MKIAFTICPNCEGDPVETETIMVPKEVGSSEMVEKIDTQICHRCDGTGTVKPCPRCGIEMGLVAGFWPGEDAPAWRCGKCELELDAAAVDPLSAEFLKRAH